jgi:hypothetical protein
VQRCKGVKVQRCKGARVQRCNVLSDNRVIGFGLRPSDFRLPTLVFCVAIFAINSEPVVKTDFFLH